MFKPKKYFLGRSKRARHREKIDASPVLPHSLLVAKSVSRKDYLENPTAMEAYWKEWNNLERKGVWRWEEVTEWKSAVKKHQSNPHPEHGTEIHFGYLFGIMVEKEFNMMLATQGDTLSTEWFACAL